jgi:predicted MFS family arabinose efflux permease
MSASPARTTAARAGIAAWGILIAIAFARFAFGYQVQTIASLAPDLAATFHLSFTAIGSLVGAYLLPGIVTALGFGFLAQVIGDRALLGGGIAVMALGSAGAALAAGPAGIAAARVVAGTGAVALTVMQSKVIADRFAGRGFLLALGLMVGAFPVGIGSGQLTHAPIAHAFGWRAAFLAGAVPAAIGAAVLFASWRGGGRAGRRRLGWPTPRECLLVVIAGLVWTFYNAAFVGFLTYVPALMAREAAPAWLTDAVMDAATWGNLPAILFGSAVAARFGATRVFLIGMLCLIVATAAMASGRAPLLWGVLFGTIGALHVSLIVAIGTLSAAPENRAVGMALFYTTYYLGGTIFPAVCGLAADRAGTPGGALVCGAAIALLALPAWFAHRRLAPVPG